MTDIPCSHPGCPNIVHVERDVPRGASVTAFCRDHMPADSRPSDEQPVEHYRARIAAERQHQIDVGYTFEHDTKPYRIGGLLFAAGALANAAEFLDRNPGREDALDNPPAGWPWPLRFWKLDTPERMREKAGALALAAIDAMAGGQERTESSSFPVWSGTGASARQIADLVRQVDPYAEVDTDRHDYVVRRAEAMTIDTVPNRITLAPGDRPVFDGERWSVDESGRVTS